MEWKGAEKIYHTILGSEMKIFKYAHDGGPKQVIASLIGNDEVIFTGLESGNNVFTGEWQNYLTDNKFSGVVVGTSRSIDGRKSESSVRIAATSLGLPVILIEDYPGNYYHVGHADTNLLIVDSQFSIDIYKKELNDLLPPCWICNSVRYDQYRSPGNEPLSAVPVGAAGTDSVNILWIGQTETNVNADTLRRLCSTLASYQVCVLLKAHPRDPGYHEGVYQRVLEDHGVEFIDVTGLSFVDCLAHKLVLCMTLFSSLAVEAGFYGIPAVHLLYEDIGFQRLLDIKGYGIPPWCTAGASFLVTDDSQQEDIIRTALFDDAERNRVMSRFSHYFSSNEPVHEQLLQKIQEVVRNGTHFDNEG